jgi:hypothetical protein
MFLDFLLLASATWVCFKSRGAEAMLLLAYFFGSHVFVETLKILELFNQLGEYWYLIYAAWISLFAVLTQSVSIARLYATQQLLCLLVVITWNSTDIFYDSYYYLTAIFYLLQLGHAYGNASSNSIDDSINRGFYMAHNRA